MLGLALNLWMGCWLTGFAVTGNNVVGDYLAIQLDWNTKQAEFRNSVIATVEVFGVTAGSFAAGYFVEFGRRKTIIFSFVVILLATFMTLVLNFWMIVIGKLIFSLACGVSLIATNLYINETVPRAQ